MNSHNTPQESDMEYECANQNDTRSIVISNDRQTVRYDPHAEEEEEDEDDSNQNWNYEHPDDRPPPWQPMEKPEPNAANSVLLHDWQMDDNGEHMIFHDFQIISVDYDVPPDTEVVVTRDTTAFQVIDNYSKPQPPKIDPETDRMLDDELNRALAGIGL